MLCRMWKLWTKMTNLPPPPTVYKIQRSLIFICTKPAGWFPVGSACCCLCCVILQAFFSFQVEEFLCLAISHLKILTSAPFQMITNFIFSSVFSAVWQTFSLCMCLTSRKDLRMLISCIIQHFLILKYKKKKLSWLESVPQCAVVWDGCCQNVLIIHPTWIGTTSPSTVCSGDVF